MSKPFRTIMDRILTNGHDSTTVEVLQPTTPRGVLGMPKEVKKNYLDRAHAAKREGVTLFMDKATCQGFAKILGTPATSQLMRRLLAEVAAGTLVLTAPGKTLERQTSLRQPATLRTELPMTSVTSMSQLPLSLKQAAVVLNVTSQMLYYRCNQGRIEYVKDGSRYFLPAQEVKRLQIIGIN